ncbi:MAG: type II secretion system protein [Patescibacteria group bacterium]
MKKINHKKAFTIIEVLIAVSIIAIIGAVFNANYKVSSSQSALTVFQQSLSQDIGLAKWKAIDLEYYDSQTPVYWGVSLSEGSNEYTIFADLNGNWLLDVGEDDPLKGAKINKAKVDAYISNINLANNLNVLFSTEGDFLTFYDVDNSIEVFGELRIELKSESLNIGKLVFVNSFSLVDVSDCFCSPAADYQCSWCP